MSFKRDLFLALSLILIMVSIITMFKLKQNVQQRTLEQLELNELQHIKYGLLNPHEWKRQVSDVLGKNLEGLNLESIDKTELRGEIIKVLERLFVEVEQILERKKTEGMWLENIVRTLILEFAMDMNDLRREIPGLADAIIDELDSEQSIERLQEFLKAKIYSMVEGSIGQEDTAIIDDIVARNECSTPTVCKEYLTELVHQKNRKINQLSIWSLVSLMLVFVLWYMLKDGLFRSWQWYALFISVLIMLYGGLTLPMINIDARIDSLQIEFMEREISFKDQLLFFQSKSILEVVQILIGNGDIQTILVGVLILLFSIVFPLLKMISILILKVKSSIRNNRPLNFLAYKTGKWSMADVFVVAIFMAFIGFRGVVSSQLAQLDSAVTKADIITTDNSNLQVGILFFTAFVILGIAFAIVSKKNNQILSLPAVDSDTRLLER